MKRIIWTYGLIAGAIVGAMLLISIPLYKQGTLNFDNGELVGYTTMVIALSLVFFGIKSYRDQHAGGQITFGTGLKIGLLITLVAAVIYALSWEVSYRTMADEFMAKIEEHYVQQAKMNGATEADLQGMKDFQELYKNPVVRFGVTLFEIFPVGLVISLISAVLLRQKDFLPLKQSQESHKSQ